MYNNVIVEQSFRVEAHILILRQLLNHLVMIKSIKI
jgi:hypothetical protein